MHADTHRTLEVLLDREIDIARSLQTTLDAERAALTGDSPDTVTQLAAEKPEQAVPPLETAVVPTSHAHHRWMVGALTSWQRMRG